MIQFINGFCMDAEWIHNPPSVDSREHPKITRGVEQMRHKVNKMALTLGLGFGLFAGSTIVLGETVHQMSERLDKQDEVIRDTKKIAKDSGKQVQDLKKQNKDLQSSNK